MCHSSVHCSDAPSSARPASGVLAAAAICLAASTGCAVTHEPLASGYSGRQAISREQQRAFRYLPLAGDDHIESERLESTAQVERRLLRMRVPAAAPDSVHGARLRASVDPTLRPAPPRPLGSDPTEMQVVFEYYRSLNTTEKQAPAIIVTPILGGNYELSRYISRYFSGLGFHCVIVMRGEEVLMPQWELDDLDSFLRRSVVARRHVLDWLGRQPEVDADRLGSFGISLGSLVHVVLCAVEPNRLRSNVFVMCGGDVPSVLRHSTEGRLVRFRDAWMSRHGASESDLEVLARQTIQSDPLNFASSVDARDALLIGSRFDKVIPFENQEKLRLRMGGPERVVIPTGHYSAFFYLNVIRDRAFEFLRQGLRPAPVRVRPAGELVRVKGAIR